MVTPARDGVSIGDFKEADEIMKGIGEEMGREWAGKMFYPLVCKMLKRMGRYKPATQKAYKDAMRSQTCNPAAFKEMMTEFGACWVACDKDKDGVLNRAEFKDFVVKNCENMKARFGEATRGDDHEDE